MTGLIRCVPALAALLLIMPAAAQADDSRGMFSVKSVGTVSCERYLDARKQKGEEYLLFAGYLGGYMTAYNQWSPETFDILPWQTVDTLLGMLANYCSKQSDRNFAVAVNELIRMLISNRLATASELVVASTQHGSVKIYRETMRRVQARLAEMGHYTGNIDGLFGNQTQGGLEKFQETKGLKKTGLPDQPTLFNLLLVERSKEE